MPLDLAWVICDHAGQPLRGEPVADNRRLVFSRNLEAEARCTLSLTDELCVAVFDELTKGIPQLHVLVDGERCFAGWWTPMRGSSNSDGASSVELVFRSPFSRLRGLLTADTVAYTATDQGLIAKALADYAQSTYGSVGLQTSTGLVEATKVRDRAYEHKDIGEAIVQLTEVIDGFDFYETYLDPRDNAGALADFHVEAAQGQDRDDVRFEYGPGTMSNCGGYEFSTSLPITRARALGDAAGEATAPYQDQIDTAAETLYGPYMATVSASDVSETDTLADKARDALRPAPAHVTAFRPDPAVAPLPIGADARFWIGDTVRWNVDDGAMQEQSSPRVQTIEIGFDDSDNISDLLVGIDPESAGSYLLPAVPSMGVRRFVQQQREIYRRLSASER